MQIENKFQVPLPLAQAWVFLMNIEEVAPCFPGVTLTEIVDTDTQKGKIRVKLGPVVMIFAGTVHFEHRDEADYSARIKAAWREEKGRGTAATVTRFKLTPCDGGTEVSIDSDVQLAGQVAQYGRGLGMIAEISEQLIAQFAANLREKALALHARGDTAQPTGNPAPGQAAAAAPSRSQARHKEISGFSILWKVLAARIKSIFVR
ncbi:MAG TPA: SRPBCC family protein [Herbaspirillum sp.]|jgi:carbon monoxide dehydrogenase subunit G